MEELKPLTRANIKVEPLVNGSAGSEFEGIEKIPDSMLDVMLNGPTVMSIKKGEFRGLARQLYAALQTYESRRAAPESKPLGVELVGCKTCQFVDRDPDEEPCRHCKGAYLSRYAHKLEGSETP